jgi:hypothetical protein
MAAGGTNLVPLINEYAVQYNKLVYNVENQKIMVSMYQDAANKVSPLVSQIAKRGKPPGGMQDLFERRNRHACGGKRAPDELPS